VGKRQGKGKEGMRGKGKRREWMREGEGTVVSPPSCSS